MSLKCTIAKVVMTKQLPVFILVQLGNKGQSQQKSSTNKFRTQLSLNTPRPQFRNNEFVFNLLSGQKQPKLTGNQVYSLKFGLMVMPCDNYDRIITEDYNKAKPIAITSLNLSIQRLRQNGQKPQRKYFQMLDSKGKVHAQFECVLQYFDNVTNQTQNQQNQSNKQRKLIQEAQTNEQKVLFNPLISWMMYDENCHDPLRQKNCLKALQEQLNILFAKYHQSKTQEQQLQTLFNQLQQDEKQLLSELQMYQKMNNKISQKLNQKQSLEALKLQIDMLKGSREGKQLLLQKLEYFQDRIFKQEQIYEELILKYENMKPQIQKKLKESQSIAVRLKGKQEQEFQIQNNEAILKNYEQLLYSYKSNEQVIRSLMRLSRKSSTSEYTRQQAELFLSQVKYEIKLEEINIESKSKGSYLTGKNQEDYQQKILSMIQDQMKNTKIAHQQMHNPYQNQQNKQEEEFVLKIKLDSLNQEIQKIKTKISKIKDKKQMSNHFYNNKSLLSTQ